MELTVLKDDARAVDVNLKERGTIQVLRFDVLIGDPTFYDESLGGGLEIKLKGWLLNPIDESHSGHPGYVMAPRAFGRYGHKNVKQIDPSKAMIEALYQAILADVDLCRLICGLKVSETMTVAEYCMMTYGVNPYAQ